MPSPLCKLHPWKYTVCVRFIRFMVSKSLIVCINNPYNMAACFCAKVSFASIPHVGYMHAYINCPSSYKARQDEGDCFLGESEGGATAACHWARVQFASPWRNYEWHVGGSRSRDCAAVIWNQLQLQLRSHGTPYIPRNSHLAHPVRDTIVVWHVFSRRPRTSWFVATSQQTVGLLQKRHAGHLRIVQLRWWRLFQRVKLTLPCPPAISSSTYSHSIPAPHPPS